MNINRLLQDIEEGIIVLDNSGTILHLNPKAEHILNLKDTFINKKYVDLFNSDDNDEFHQMIIDAVIDKKVVHKKELNIIQKMLKKLFTFQVQY